MKTLLFFATAALLFATSARSAESGQLWSGGASGTRRLYTINPETGSRLGKFTFPTGFSGVNGLAYNSTDHALYITTVSNFSSALTPNYPLIYRFDLASFSLSSYPITGITRSVFDRFDGLEYDARENVFWGAIPAAQQLVRIDAATFQVDVVGQFSRNSNISGLAYDRATDTLYGIDDYRALQEGSKLVAIDKLTATLTNIGTSGLGLGLTDIDSLAFDPFSRQLFAVSDADVDQNNRQRLLRINPATGVADFVGISYLQLEAYQGLAFVTPEPDASFLAYCVFAAAVQVQSRSKPKLRAA